MYLGSSPSQLDALRQIRRSSYGAAFLAQTPFAQFWLRDLRAHAALALIMARAAAATMSPAALTRRGVSDLASLSMSAVHSLLAEACTRGDFQRNADAGDRRRVMLMPAPDTAAAFAALVREFAIAASGGALHPVVAEEAAHEPQMLALYARFASALVAVRRPGGRLWVQPASLAVMADLMAARRDGVSPDSLRAAAARRGTDPVALDEDLGFAAMAGLAVAATDGRLRLSTEGRRCMLEHLELWRSWSSEARLALATLASPMSTRVA